jgi:hypothetical protein
MSVAFPLQHKPESEPYAVNIDTSISGRGGRAIALGKVDPQVSKEAWERAREETDDPAERVVLAYKYIDEQTSGKSMPSNNDFSLEPDATLDYKVKGQPANLDIPNKKKAVKKKAKVARDESATERQLRRVKRELAELKRASATPKPSGLKQLGLDYLDEQRQLLEEQRYQQELQEQMQRELEKAQFFGGGSMKVADVKKAVKDVDPVAEGFRSLGIPNLGPTATKPAYRVQFDLGSAGKQEAWYHWVGEHDGGLFLIYDARFEYGIRYTPPNMGFNTPIKVKLPDHGKSYTVFSMDFTHPFGVFNITNLIIAPETQPEPEPIDYGDGFPKMETFASFLTPPGEKNDDGEEWRDTGRYYTPGEQDLQNQLRMRYQE